MISERRKTRSALLCGVVFVAALLGTTLSVSAEPLRIAYTGLSLVSGPLWVTHEAGIFKKYNLDVDKLLYLAGGPPSTQALIAGEVDVSFTAAGAVVAANLAGAEVVLIGTTIDTLPFEVWAVPTIKNSSQLRGTKMGVTRIGATSDFVGRYILKKWGLKPNDDVVIFQTGGGPEVLAALKGGSIQSGVMSTGPFTLRAEKDGFVRLADVSTMGLAYAFGPFAARESFLKSQPDLAGRFVKAYVEGIHRFKTDRRLALAVIEKYMKSKTTPEEEQLYEMYANRHIKQIPEATPEGIQTILDELALVRPLPSGTTPQRFVDSRFVKEIRQSGFVDALYRTR